MTVCMPERFRMKLSDEEVARELRLRADAIRRNAGWNVDLLRTESYKSISAEWTRHNLERFLEIICRGTSQ